MTRQPSTQQIAWLLDLARSGQLDLNPPYQRKSVWSSKDRKFFLDTIFRNYPAPPIFIHRSINDDGFSKYHVVDGKQRLETIVAFADNKIALGVDFGDDNIDGKKINDMPIEYKRKFWDYTLVVDFIASVEGNSIEVVFDRLNRNARNLQPQELRHARFDGWFIGVAETEAQDEFWWTYKISTKARDRRMKNVQFISELIMLCIDSAIVGFDQMHIDNVYAKYDDIEDLIENHGFEPESVTERVSAVKRTIDDLNEVNNCVATYAAGVNSNFYTLWSVLNTMPEYDHEAIAARYEEFMRLVEVVQDGINEGSVSENHKRYADGVAGASTDYSQRKIRHDALYAELTR